MGMNATTTGGQMPDLITINEAASRLDVSPGEVSRLISRGILGTVTLVDADSLPVKSS